MSTQATFGKRTKSARYNASATQTVRGAWEMARAPEAKEAFRQVAEWTGWDAIATAEIRKSVARILMGMNFGNN